MREKQLPGFSEGKWQNIQEKAEKTGKFIDNKAREVMDTVEWLERKGRHCIREHG